MPLNISMWWRKERQRKPQGFILDEEAWQKVYLTPFLTVGH